MMDKNLVLNKIQANEQEAFTFLEQLVNIDSGNDHKEGISEVAHLIGAFLTQLAFTVEYLNTPGEPVQLLARRPGTGGQRVLFNGHMDTVFPRGTAAARPFKIIAGKVYGPGVADMKGGLVTALFTVKSLLEAGWEATEFTFMLCGDEEISHPRTNAVANFKRAAQGQDVCFCLEPGRANGAVVIGRKGALRPKLKVQGKAAHSGLAPEKGINANLEMAHKIIALQALNNFAVGTTYNVGVMQGGTLANIIADYAECEVDIRAKTIAEAEKAQADVELVAAKTYVPGTTTIVEANQISFMPFETTKAVEALYAVMCEQAAALGQEELLAEYSGGCSDVSWTALGGATSICAVGPKGVNAHTEQEFFWQASLLERIQLLAFTIMALTEKQS
ncbi:MAG: M20 family metallopeptidase [Acidaminococcaceae bacterium]